MRVLVIGSGNVGKTICEELANEGHDVTVVDDDLNALNDTANMFDVIGVQGNGASVSVLKNASVKKADLVIAVASSDEINILCCSLAKKLGARHTIARVRNPEYTELLSLMREDWGLSMTINPERAAAREINRMIRFPSAAKVDTFAKGRVELVEFRVHSGSPMIGKTLIELSSMKKWKVLLCVVRRNGQVFIPTGDFILQEGDYVNATASEKDITSFFKFANIYRQKIKNAMIVGGGPTCYYLTALLLQAGVTIKIIEKEKRKAYQLAEHFPDATVICGDGTDQELLLQEGLDKTDAFIALSSIDEENAMTAMFAYLTGVHKVIVKVDNHNYADLLRSMGVESIVSIKELTANYILRYVRAMQNSIGSSIEALHRIAEDKAEMLEFHIRKESPITNTPLKSLKLKDNVLIACINRKNKMLVPSGEDYIQVGDSVIVATTDVRLNDFEDILK